MVEGTSHERRLRELWRESAARASIYAGETQNAFRVIELLIVQVQNRNLHRARVLALFAISTFDGIPVYTQKAVLLKYAHYCSYRADISTPKSRNPPGRINEAD